jgi:hypothetical protein
MAGQLLVLNCSALCAMPRGAASEQIEPPEFFSAGWPEADGHVTVLH